MDFVCLISRALVTQGTKEVMNKHTFLKRRQRRENSSFNPFLMTSIVITEAASNKDAVLVTQRKADLWTPQISLYFRDSVKIVLVWQYVEQITQPKTESLLN